MAASMLLEGNTAGLVKAGSDGFAERIELLAWCRVEWTSAQGWKLDGEPIDLWPLGPLWHVPMFTLPGSPLGLNPLAYARRTTYAHLAAQEFGGNFFRDGGHPSAILSPQTDPGEDGAAALKATFKAATTGTNREPAVLPQSLKYTPLQINPDDSQFIELMQFTAGEIAGFFGLEPQDVGAPVQGTALQYSNRENRQQDLLQNAVDPVLIPIEEALADVLDTRISVKFNRAGVLRSDLQGRYDSYVKSAQYQQVTGVPIVTNEQIRDFEDYEPLQASEENQQ